MIYDLNPAFLENKLWRLVQFLESFLARVLRGKYKKNCFWVQLLLITLLMFGEVYRHIGHCWLRYPTKSAFWISDKSMGWSMEKLNLGYWKYASKHNMSTPQNILQGSNLTDSKPNNIAKICNRVEGVRYLKGNVSRLQDYLPSSSAKLDC